jgi:hypothetical protein
MRRPNGSSATNHHELRRHVKLLLDAKLKRLQQLQDAIRADILMDQERRQLEGMLSPSQLLMRRRSATMPTVMDEEERKNLTQMTNDLLRSIVEDQQLLGNLYSTPYFNYSGYHESAAANLSYLFPGLVAPPSLELHRPSSQQLLEVPLVLQQAEQGGGTYMENVANQTSTHPRINLGPHNSTTINNDLDMSICEEQQSHWSIGSSSSLSTSSMISAHMIAATNIPDIASTSQHPRTTNAHGTKNNVDHAKDSKNVHTTTSNVHTTISDSHTSTSDSHTTNSNPHSTTTSTYAAASPHGTMITSATNCSTSSDHPPSPNRKTRSSVQRDRDFLPLGTEQDRYYLSKFLCFLRLECIEVFTATEEDVFERSSSKRVQSGQVGIRCRFCAHLDRSSRVGRSANYPSSIERLYQGVSMMIYKHFPYCKEIPPEITAKFNSLRTHKKKGDMKTRAYWIEAAKAKGMVDSSHAGIQLCTKQNK